MSKHPVNCEFGVQAKVNSSYSNSIVLMVILTIILLLELKWWQMILLEYPYKNPSKMTIMFSISWIYWLYYTNHEPLALDGTVVRKISKRHFFQDIKNSFHGVTQIGLKPHQNFFKIFFSTNTVARGVQSFCILEGATCLLIEQWPKFFYQFSPDMWWTNAENFKLISWPVSELWSKDWKILVTDGLLP